MFYHGILMIESNKNHFYKINGSQEIKKRFKRETTCTSSTFTKYIIRLLRLKISGMISDLLRFMLRSTNFSTHIFIRFLLLETNVWVHLISMIIRYLININCSFYLSTTPFNINRLIIIIYEGIKMHLKYMNFGHFKTVRIT